MTRLTAADGSWQEVADPTVAANIDAIQTKALAALANLEAADTNWATLTVAQKDAAARLAVRVCAGLIRLDLGNYR